LSSAFVKSLKILAKIKEKNKCKIVFLSLYKYLNENFYKIITELLYNENYIKLKVNYVRLY